jgi:hypothetical protein
MFWSKNLIELFLIAHEELLDALYFLFELYCDLIHLSTLHVVVINLISSYRAVITLFLVLYNHFVVHMVPVSKFIDHELLHLDNVNDIHLCFDGVKNQNTDLTGYTTKAVIFKDKKH